MTMTPPAASELMLQLTNWLSLTRLSLTLSVLSVLGLTPAPLTSCTLSAICAPRLTSCAPLEGSTPVTVGLDASATTPMLIGGSSLLGSAEARTAIDKSRRFSSGSKKAREFFFPVPSHLRDVNLPISKDLQIRKTTLG